MLTRYPLWIVGVLCLGGAFPLAHLLQQQAPAPLQNLDFSSAELLYTQVKFTGKQDNDHLFLLDNKTFQGKVGYELLLPFITDSGLLVFINLGWREQQGGRGKIGEIALKDERYQFTGSVYVPPGEQLVLGDELYDEGWPKLMQTVDVEMMRTLAAYPAQTQVFPYTVRAGEEIFAQASAYWPVVNVDPQRHRGYAIQWFAMAAALLVLYFYYSFRTQSRLEHEEEQH